MAEIKWIKISTNVFDDEKIKLIDAMPERDAIIVIWFRLLVLAGKVNDNGFIYVNKKMSYTDEMLATLFNRPLNTIRLALSTFESFEMIEIENCINITNWEKHQNIDGMEKIKEQNRIRKQKQREKQKQIIMSHDSHVTITSSHATDIDIELDIDKDKDKDKDDDTNLDKLNKIDSKEEKEVRLLDSSSIKFKNDLKELKDIAIKATGLDRKHVDDIMLPSKYRNINIRDIINKIKESQFLLGELDTKPNINHFSVQDMLNRIMADGYKDKPDKTKKEFEFKKTEYKDFTGDIIDEILGIEGG